SSTAAMNSASLLGKYAYAAVPLKRASRAISATDVPRYPSRPKRAMAASRSAWRVRSPFVSAFIRGRIPRSEDLSQTLISSRMGGHATADAHAGGGGGLGVRRD